MLVKGATSHFLNEWWIIANKTLGNKFQIGNQNTTIFIQENWFENVVCKMAAILFRPQCVGSTHFPVNSEPQFWHLNYISIPRKNMNHQAIFNLHPKMPLFLFHCFVYSAHTFLALSKIISIGYYFLGNLWYYPMGLLPDTQNCGCACAGNAGNVFPVTAG